MLRDLVGPVRAKELEEELGELIENLQILGYKEVKPWAEFLSAMKPPAQWDAKHLEQRVTTNFLYYRSNYLLICCSIILFRIILSPLTLFSILLTVTLIGYIMLMVKVPLMLGETIIDSQKRNWACVALAFVILGLSGTLAELFWSIFISVTLNLAHMLFRARSISSKMNKVQEEVKLNAHSDRSPVTGKATHTSKIVSNVNSLISEVFNNSSATSKAKKHDLFAPNDISGASTPNPGSNSFTSIDDDIESRPAADHSDDRSGSPYHPNLSISTGATGSAVKRSSPIVHGRAPGKND
jgi:hypothetical protein